MEWLVDEGQTIGMILKVNRDKVVLSKMMLPTRHVADKNKKKQNPIEFIEYRQ